MSEVLTNQEMASFQEVPTSLEMGELHKIDNRLQDIPLTEGVSAHQLQTSSHVHNGDEGERKLKTNSLKRFFRLPTKKKMLEDFGDAERTENKFQKVKISNAASNTKELVDTCSKATLKSSLNSYWNSVFKQKKSRKSSKSAIELEEDVNEASCSVNSESPLSSASTFVDKTNVLPEIQSLKISETYPTK